MTNILNAFPSVEQKVITGHFPFWFLRGKDPRFDSSFTFTILREPVSRVISNYFFNLEKKNRTDYPIDIFPNLIDFFRNSIRSVKPCFLAPSTPNFSAMCIHMAKKLGGESAQKSLVSPTKANFERSLLLQSCIFPSNFAIVEGNASIRKDLNAFMALSSDENNIFFFCQIDCQVNRFFAI